MKTQQDKLKTMLALFLLLTVILATMGIYYEYYENVKVLKNNDTEGTSEEGILSVILKIDFAGIIPAINMSITCNHSLTAYSILLEANIPVKTKQYGEMIYVQAINNVIENTNKTNYYWFYYVNGISGNVASNYYVLANNSIVEWKYEAWSGIEK